MSDFIVFLIESINNSIVDLSASSSLTGSMGGWNSSLYGYISSIQTHVALPIGYIILSLFCVLALLEVAVKAESHDGMMSVESIIKLLVKLSLCIWAINNSSLLLNAIYDVTTYFTSQASTYFSSVELSRFAVDEIQAAIDDMGFWGQLGLLFLTLATWLIMQFAIKVAQVIVIARFIELYLFFCVAPVPIATLPSHEMSQIGKNFLKAFTAVCVQGILIFLVLSFFPFIADSVLSDSDGFLGIIAGMLGYSIVLVVAVFSTSKWAKSICNAM